jgi:hypothetical protein
MVVVAITQTSNLLVTLNSSGNERTRFWNQFGFENAIILLANQLF